MSELQQIQRAVGVLIPRFREQQSAMLQPDEALPIAMELTCSALAMKPEHRQAGVLIAERFSARMGLDPEHVTQFTLRLIEETINEAGEQA